MSIGNRIFTKRPQLNTNLIEEYEQLPVANIADKMNRISVIGNDIKLISSPKKPVTVGFAVTVKVRAGDNLMLHAALEMANENDIIIVSNEGDRSRALMGEIMATYAHYDKHIGGIILDGPIRDLDAISKMELPLFAAGANPAGPFKQGPGEVNTPIAISGIAICPGDLIVADTDGIVVIPLMEASNLLDQVKEYSKYDSGKVEAAKAGKANKDWVKRIINETGVEIIDGTYN
ncbi:RraA family protein [Celerinatantimonas diazotrophica]|uniref:Putative 4-hydroxy-4-methyl-2-oxoglutarate aldolase n=1 Tax=Celerinatantimonas diazotrophica TaxID=412034 RepID=A0A4R1KGX7_9GAMM|nr:RraA family protein [Celerinatantimonas diazotrophica]TCK63972.1 regulator of RNase E activity RraA [Celerinatantimonas diazotrophica]CAG9297057.1 4-hydroxy-4-methyl-2-oxoglutarate aldolase/4-carboxy-4-hydroxy-2-oxoadipate aldolase [Celerinatantimonas diazotrophica]